MKIPPPVTGLLAWFCGCCLPFAAHADVYYVDGKKGSDSSDGRSPDAEHALATIQEAARRAGPGDVITVAEGVYEGPIDLHIAGQPDRPITIQAASRKKNAVIITNAEPALRKGAVPWTVVDESLGLYRAALARPTCRILYSGVDLQPYASLDALKTFVTADGNPGPRHGYYYDEKAQMLYVRLHVSGKYGSPNPSDHLICVGPRTGGGYAGNNYDGPLFFNLGLRGNKPLHVVVDGFTFETPGYAGVYVDGSDVVVRNSWFLGCRAGVSGRRESADPSVTSNRVTVEFCDYHQYPAYDDMIELLELRKEGRIPAAAARFPLFWWSRKGNGAGNNNTYETGICNLVGSDWIVRNNDIHDAFEGLSTWAIRWSKGLVVTGNRLERLVDNAVESEDHAFGMRIYGNYIVNVVEPFSWQPLGGEPWPGSIYIYDNVVQSDLALNQLITAVSDWTPGWFKAGASSQNWEAPWNSHMKDLPRDVVRAPGDGVVVFNNTVFFPGGEFLTRVQPPERKFENFRFVNNVSVAAGFSRQQEDLGGGIAFSHNAWAYAPEGGVRGQVFAGADGTVFPESSSTWIASMSQNAEDILDGAPWKDLPGAGVPSATAAFPGAADIHTVGAGLNGRPWKMPETGPRE